MTIEKRVSKYLEWNDALLAHFFRDEERDEVFLYVTEEELNAIGQKNEIGGVTEFLNAVLIPCDMRPTFYRCLRRRFAGGPEGKGKTILTAEVYSNLPRHSSTRIFLKIMDGNVYSLTLSFWLYTFQVKRKGKTIMPLAGA